MPQDVAEKYEKYCKVTKQKLTEPLQAITMESISRLHNTEKLDQILQKTRNRTNSDSLKKFHVQLPDEAAREINTYCSFFKLSSLKSHFLYYLIEENLLQSLENMLKDG